MVFFVMFFLVAFNLNDSRDNSNEDNISIETDVKQFDGNENMSRHDDQQNINQILNLENIISLNMDVDLELFDSLQNINQTGKFKEEISKNINGERADNNQNINQGKNSENEIFSSTNINKAYLNPHQVLDLDYEASSSIDVDLVFFDSLQNINRSNNLENLISSSIDSEIKKNEEIFHNENKSENDNISILTNNKHNNEDSENLKITSDDKEFGRDIEEALENPYVFAFVKEYEQSLISDDINFMPPTNSLMISSGAIGHDNSANRNEKTNISNTSVERQIENYSKPSYNLPSTSFEVNSNSENEIKKNTNVECYETLYNRLGYISYVNNQHHYSIDDGEFILISEMILDNNQITTIPDLIQYKECLKSLSMKNNLIKSIPKRITKLKYLTKLDLSCNKINKIYYKIKIMKLEWLDLSYNCLKYSSCKPVFLMTTLKYLNLQNNEIDIIGKFNSEGLEKLNISNNPIISILDSFYELPNITQLSISNIKVTSYAYCSKVLPNLKVLDLSHNKLCHQIYNIMILFTLEEVNLSNCGLNNFQICLEILHFKKLILLQNNIQSLPISFKKLRSNIETLDLRENPLEIITTKTYIGALGILEHFYGKVLLDESIIHTIQALSFDEIYSQKYEKELVHFKKIKENKLNAEFNIIRICEILESTDVEIIQKVDEIIALAEEMKDSGFLSFERTMEKAIKIIKLDICKNLRIQRALNYLNNKFSSKFYKLLEAILLRYKIQSLKSALIYIYNSNEHLNYWMYHLRDILSLTGIKKIELNPQIHNDKNIILSSFINIIDPDSLARSIKFELEKDKKMIKIFYNVLSNIQDRPGKRPIGVKLEDMKTVHIYSIKYILKMYQIIG